MDNKESKGLGTLLHVTNLAPETLVIIRTYRTLFQLIEPSHGNRPKARRKHFAQEGLIPRVNGHSLVEVAHMLHKVDPSIIDSKGRLSEAMRKLSPINSTRKG